MIYINQCGECELGRGETLEAAMDAATVSRDDLLDARQIVADGELMRPINYGDVYYTTDPVVGYNDD